jgi:hypothetical protein
MRVGPAVGLLVPSVLVVLAALAWGPRRGRRWIDDLPVAIGGIGLGLGALMFQPDASPAAWWLTPPLVGGLAVAHVRAMFAGDGPLRV